MGPVSCAPIEAARERFDFALLAGSSASVYLDAVGGICGASATAASMLGYEPAGLIGRTLLDLAAQGWRDAAEVASGRVRFGGTGSFELMLEGRSGRLSLIEMTAHPVAADKAGPAAFVLTWAHRRVGKRPAHEAIESELHRLAHALMRMREGERLDLATRLHDDLAPTLVMAKYLVEDALQRFGRSEPGDVAGLLRAAAARLRGVIAELRAISTDLRPALLDDLGLIPTLEWYCRGFGEAHPAIAMVRSLTAAEGSIGASLKVEIFRIVQDALGNVARHSQASAVRVSLVEEDGGLLLGVEDNGSGFEPALALRPGHTSVGLPSIRKRIEATGGRFILETGLRRGTRVGAVWALSPDLGTKRTPNPDPSLPPDLLGAAT